MNVRLTINDKDADIFQKSDISVKIFKKLIDNSDVTKRSGDYTLDLSLPRTKRNLQLLNFLGDQQIRNQFYGQKYLTAKIFSDSSLLIQGKLIIQSVNLPENSIQCNIISKMIDWKIDIGNKELTDILSIPSYLYTGTKFWPESPVNSVILQDFLTPTWVNNVDNETQFPIISYGNFFRPDGWSLTILNYQSHGGAFTAGSYQFTINLSVLQTGNSSASNLNIHIVAVIEVIFGNANNFISATVQNYNYYPLLGNADPFPGLVDTEGAVTLNNCNVNVFDVTRPVFFNLTFNRLYNNFDQIDYPFTGLDILPTVRAHSIIKSIFRDINWNVEFEQNNSTNFKNLLIPSTEEEHWNWGTLALAKGYKSTSRTTPLPSTANEILTAPDSGYSNSLMVIPRPSILAPHPGYPFSGNNQPFPTLVYYNLGMYKDEQYETTDIRFDYNFLLSRDPILNNLYGTYTVPEDGEYIFQSEINIEYLLFNPVEVFTPLPINNNYFKFRAAFCIFKHPEGTKDETSIYGDIGQGLFDPNIDWVNFPVNPFVDSAVLVGQAIELERFNTNPAPPLIFKPSSPPPAFASTHTWTWNGASVPGNVNLGLPSTITLTTEPIKLKRGDIIRTVFITPKVSNQVDAIRLFHQNSTNWNRFEVLQAPGDIELQPQKWLPKMKQIDFIKNFIDQYNLFYIANEETSTITFLSRERFFLNAANAVDWSDKCTYQDAILSPASTVKEYNFSWLKEDDDWNNADYTKIDLHIKNDNNIGTDVQDIEVIFSPTFDRAYKNSAYNQTWSIPTIAFKDDLTITPNEANRTIAHTPRMLRMQGLDAKKWRLVTDYNFVYTEQDNYLYCTWSEVTSDYFQFPISDGIYNNYWEKTINDIVRTEQLELPVMLTPFDIYTLNLRRPILIDQTLYYIQEIKGFDPVEDSQTRVIIYKII